MKTKVKIAIAEDKELLRKAIISLVEEDDNFEVTSESSNGLELINNLSKSLPDLVLMDYKMPVMDGKEALIAIKKKYPEMKILILSQYDQSELIIDLITHGANGFISKGANTETFFKAINTVICSGKYFDAKVSEALLNNLIQKEDEKYISLSKKSLSEREILILKEICNGGTNKIISNKLYIAPSTVDFHRANIYKKTKTKSIANLVIYAIKNGIIAID
jgi:DNA-binding NarL/FixJ family response regulator